MYYVPEVKGKVFRNFGKVFRNSCVYIPHSGSNSEFMTFDNNYFLHA